MQMTKTGPNQRLQLNDYEAAAKLILDEFLRLNRVMVLPSGRNTGEAGSHARVFSGFGLSNITGGTCDLARGSGIFPYWDQGELKFGILAGEEEPDHYALDLSALPDGNYKVYVRLIHESTDIENRIFWNPSGTPQEYVDNVPTRSTPTWEYVIQATSVAPPGHGEWVPLWKIPVASGVITIVDILSYHHIFFEGDSFEDSYGQEWGDGTNDRSNERRIYGAFDFHMFVQLVRRQLADMIGASPARHYSAIPRTLTAMAAQHKTSGAHSAVTADSEVVAGQLRVNGTASDLAALMLRPAALDPDSIGFQTSAKIGGTIGERHLISIDRQGVLSAPNLLLESFLYGRMDDIETDPSPGIPGRRWGKYYTVGAAGNFYINMAEKIDNNLHGRRLRINTVSGVAADVFSGIRTGGFSNGQAENGFWAIRGQPWTTAAFVAASWAAHGLAEMGFANDKPTLDSDPSRAFIRFDKATNTVKLIVVASDGTIFTGTTDLLGGLGVLANGTVYRAKLVIISPSIVRAVLYNTDIADEIDMGGKTLSTYTSYQINYSSFFVARNTNAMSETQTIDIYRWDTGDAAYVGGAYNLL